jgi:hypothetical protein
MEKGYTSGGAGRQSLSEADGLDMQYFSPDLLHWVEPANRRGGHMSPGKKVIGYLRRATWLQRRVSWMWAGKCRICRWRCTFRHFAEAHMGGWKQRCQTCAG